MPKVSVVIPCYNHGKYIDNAVNSILSQTYTDFEIIIINDGSTDPLTIDKLSQYKKSKTKVYHIENGGPSVARNFGICKANGNLILTLDADDYFDTTFLEKAVFILNEHPEIGVVTCGITIFGNNSFKYFPSGGSVVSFLPNTGAPGSALFRKECWQQAGGYDEELKDCGYEDWSFWIAVTKQGWNVHVLKEYLFYVCWHSVSRRRESNKIRHELLRQLIDKHRDVYEKYVDVVIVEKDKKMLSFRDQRNFLRSSLEYRVGRLLLLPLRFAQEHFANSKSG